MHLWDMLMAPFVAAEARSALGEFIEFPWRHMFLFAFYGAAIAAAIWIASLGGWYWSVLAVVEAISVMFLSTALIFHGVETEFRRHPKAPNDKRDAS